MPTYTYRCPTCETVIEVVQKISEKKAPECDSEGCEKRPMDTLIQQGNFLLKGQGWARDGYGKVGR